MKRLRRELNGDLSRWEVVKNLYLVADFGESGVKGGPRIRVTRRHCALGELALKSLDVLTKLRERVARLAQCLLPLVTRSRIFPSAQKSIVSEAVAQRDCESERTHLDLVVVVAVRPALLIHRHSI